MPPDITNSASADMGKSSRTLWTTASTASGVRTTEAKKDHRNSISIPRFVLAFDYKFNSQWILGAEIEFEAGGTGSAYEIENTENGEYEMEVEKAVKSLWNNSTSHVLSTRPSMSAPAT